MFDCIRHPDNEDNLGIAKTEINGVEAEVICWIEEHEDEETGIRDMSVQPLALLVSNPIFEMLKNPLDKDKPEEGAKNDPEHKEENESDSDSDGE